LCITRSANKIRNSIRSDDWARAADGRWKDRLPDLGSFRHTLRLGFVTDIHRDALDDGHARATTKANRIRLPKECPQCAFLKAPRLLQCPACGFIAERISSVEVEDGELVETKRRQKKKPDANPADKAWFFAQLKGYAQQRGYNSGWAAHKYRDKFGAWPNSHSCVDPAEPTPQVLSWIKSRQIAWAKGGRNYAASA